MENTKVALKQDEAAIKAKKLAEKLRFRLKESMAQRGDCQAFLHWIEDHGEKHA